MVTDRKEKTMLKRNFPKTPQIDTIALFNRKEFSALIPTKPASYIFLERKY